MKEKILLYGAGGHGKVCADIARLNGYKEIIFYDDNVSKNKCGLYDVIHDFDFDNNNEYDVFISIGDNKVRESVYKKYKFKLTTLIHPSSIVGSDVEIEEGTVLMPGTVVNSGTIIKKCCIVNTRASVDHDNIIDEFSHVSINAHLAGQINIGKRAIIGMNSSIINLITICDDVTLGASSTIIHDINESGTYVGTPARKIK